MESKDTECQYNSFLLREIEYLLVDVKEAFWWAFVAASIKYKAKYIELIVHL